MKRIQRKRTKGWRMPENTIYVGRPAKWGNPWTISAAKESGLFKPECCAQIVFEEYEGWLTKNRSTYSEHHGKYFDIEDQREWILENIHVLEGKDLACWCPLGKPCHADVLLKLANKEQK